MLQIIPVNLKIEDLKDAQHIKTFKDMIKYYKEFRYTKPFKGERNIVTYLKDDKQLVFYVKEIWDDINIKDVIPLIKKDKDWAYDFVFELTKYEKFGYDVTRPKMILSIMNTVMQHGATLDLRNYNSEHYKKLYGNRYNEFVKELKNNYTAVLKAYGDSK